MKARHGRVCYETPVNLETVERVGLQPHSGDMCKARHGSAGSAKVYEKESASADGTSSVTGSFPHPRIINVEALIVITLHRVDGVTARLVVRGVGAEHRAQQNAGVSSFEMPFNTIGRVDRGMSFHFCS
jgi:hypothetical protein